MHSNVEKLRARVAEDPA